MLAKVLSCAVVGLEGAVVEVEVDIASGLSAFYIVGLPDTAVQEAKERVRSAVRNSGLQFPSRRITVNLAPADVRKEGPPYVAFSVPASCSCWFSAARSLAVTLSHRASSASACSGVISVSRSAASMIACAKGLKTTSMLSME